MNHLPSFFGRWFANPQRPASAPWLGYAIALLIVAAASAIRITFFADLGRNTAYLTYYPAVVLAALFGGLLPGLSATGVSALLCYYWIQRGHMSFVESLAMGTFIVSCSMISGIAEAMRRAEARAKAEKDKAEAANQAKSIFLASMNHELRTPLNAILGFTEILRRDANIPAAQRQTLGVIHRSGEHLLALINDVLDMAKIDAGRMTLEMTAFDLNELVRDVIELMHFRAEAKNLQLVLEQTPGCPRYVQSDPAKLRQILINLIGNAIKFTDEGGVALRLDSSPVNAAQPMLHLEVEDSGVGIAAAEQEHLYQPFVRVGNPTHSQGTGLGLAITRRFVELMGGTIRHQSTLGRGTTFMVELPIARAQDAQISAPARRGKVVALAQGTPALRILIVEDQMENWLLLQHLLETVGLSVQVAENGLLGVEAFTRWKPDLIWMDIRMPVLDGLEATRRIRALEGGDRVKIVAITASVFKSESDRILSAGMNAVVRKPYRSDEIYSCLTDQLGVQFVREDEWQQGSPMDSPPNLRPESLARLPPTLRDPLLSAVLSLDSAQLAELIKEIAALDAELGRALAHHAEQLSYSAIVQALNVSSTCTPKAPP